MLLCYPEMFKINSKIYKRDLVTYVFIHNTLDEEQERYFSFLAIIVMHYLDKM